MRDANIAGLNLRFDVGTLRHIAAATGKDALSPLQGLDMYAQAAHVVHAANFRAHKENPAFGQQPIQTLNDAAAFIENLLPQDIVNIMHAFNTAMQVKLPAKDADASTANGEPAAEKKMDLITF